MINYIRIQERATDKKPKILLALRRTENKRLLKQNLPEGYHVIENSDKQLDETDFDLCVSDYGFYLRNRDVLLKMKDDASPAYLPIVLLVDDNSVLRRDPSVWELVDDIIEIPVPLKILNTRIRNQIRSRIYSQRITHQNEKLRMFEKAVHSTNNGVIITDVQQDDSPIVFVNNRFVKLTGYNEVDVIGKNCRFLQADDRNQPGIKLLRNSISEGKESRTILRNYKKDGTLFYNEISVSPIKNASGNITHYVGIQNDVTELVETQEKLRKEKELHQLVTENSTDMISRHALDGSYLYVTPSSFQLLGYRPEEMIGTNGTQYIHPDDRERMFAVHEALIESNEKSCTVSFRIKTKSGPYKWVEAISQINHNPENPDDIEFQSSTRDITQSKEHEQKLEESLTEKNILLQEIHHRVKNNLAVVSGLLQIQQFSLQDEQLFKILGNSVSRIKSMALIHEKLYQSKSLSHLDFQYYIEDLTVAIHKALNVKGNIDFSVECDPIPLNVNQAVPCALILNEAIANAFEHAFIGREGGHVMVSFKEKNGRVTAVIKDDGIGMPQKESKSMGFTIINTLVKQLSAELSITNKNGTIFSFSFNKQDKKGAYNQMM